MISIIKKILKEKNVQYLLVEKVCSSYELFFVNTDLQMNRAKDVKHYVLTVYTDNDKFMGSATVNIHPTMTKDEINTKIDEAIYAASFVKNPKFELAKKSKLEEINNQSNLEGCDKIKTACKIADTIFSVDTRKDGLLNATEIFIDEESTRLINSNGVDYKKHNTTAKIEYITTWKGKKEEVELYSYLQLGNIDFEALKADIEEKLEQAYQRSIASNMPSFKNINVVFRPTEIEEIISYFGYQSNVAALFNRISNCDVGTNFQPKNIGDYINLTIDPFMVSSISSSPFDDAGFKNEKVEIIKNGRINELWGSRQIAQYMNLNSRVNSRNVNLGTGTLDLKNYNEYLEIVSMSGIQVDPITGSYGGEIRLALYHKDNKIIPYTGGSISGFIKDCVNDLKFSKERVFINTYNGPKYLLIKNQTILGK